MSFTPADLDALDRAIAGSELLVAYDSGKVRFRNLSELLVQRHLIYNYLRRQAGYQVPCARVCNTLPVRDI